MSRLPGSPYALAGGFACGAAVSMTPFVGVHFVLAAILAWITRANIIASAIGTVVGNPWTFPFIWIWTYNLGTWLGAGNGSEPSSHIEFSKFFANVFSAMLTYDVPFLFETARPILEPMLVGGTPTAILAWFAFYAMLKPIVATYQNRRHGRRRRRLGERDRAKKETKL